MAQQRFPERGKTSFFGDLVYDRVVPQDHFLRKLEQGVDFRPFTKKLVRYYQGGAEYGPPPYEPALLFKMLLLSYLYNLSERQTEDLVNYHLPAKWFVGLAVDEAAPDHATLTLFKNRLIARKGTQVFEDLFRKVVRLARERGIRLGRIQVVDSVPSVADGNLEREKGQHEKGPRDPDARWGVKGAQQIRDEEGQKQARKEYCYGYQAHVSFNPQAGLITSLSFTPGNAYDGHQLPTLVEQDLSQEIRAEVYAGARGYDDGENHLYLKERGVKSALRLNNYRTQKQNPHKGPWLRLMADPD